MKSIIFTVIFFFFTLLPASAVKRIEANPICVAAMLTEQSDSAAIASTCKFYGYQSQGNQDGYAVFSNVNGSIIRFKYSPADDGKPYSIIEVTSKATQKDRDEILKNLQFQKTGNAYERRSIGHLTRCTPGPHSSLVFRQQPKPKKQN